LVIAQSRAGSGLRLPLWLSQAKAADGAAYFPIRWRTAFSRRRAGWPPRKMNSPDPTIAPTKKYESTVFCSLWIAADSVRVNFDAAADHGSF
jgi:hypothetical protein